MATNTNVNKADGKVWTPNDTQKEFIEILKNHPDGITMKDIELQYGKKFATGSVNILLDTENGKGYVDGQDIDVKVDLVYKDTVIGTTTKHWKLYKLTEKGLKA
jgi:hypothetical protein